MIALPVAVAALLAALWLIGLIWAAPLLRGGPRLADRLRDAAILGVAIPLVLATVHALYWPCCWIALALCVGGSIVWGKRERFREPVPWVLLAALALIVWPQLVRPPLDGDTLAYHLPNAAAWAHAHSIWTTQTRYWWYPPASELFASALYAVSTPFAVGWSGVIALALLGTRIYAWAREGARLPMRLADLLAAAVAGILPLALQAGTLQNDVWLAAFFVEVLWSAPVDDVTALRAAAMCALVKPDGWIYAFIALGASAARPRAWAAAAAAIVLWTIHDALLWHGAFVPPASTAVAHLWRSAMVAHPLVTLAQGFAVFARLAPFGLLLVFCAIASPRLARDPPLRWAGIAATIAALVMPLGFTNGTQQLVTGASLRYFAPAIAAGALVLAPHLRRFASPARWLLLAAALIEAFAVVVRFSTDPIVFYAVGFTVAVVFGAAVLSRVRARTPLAVAGACVVVLTAVLASRTTARFYSDALAVRGHRSGVYAWIAARRPPRVAGWGLRTGTVAVLTPQSVAADVPDADPCGHARRAAAILIAVGESSKSDRFNRGRLHDAATCGTVLYRDPIAIVVTPRELP